MKRVVITGKNGILGKDIARVLISSNRYITQAISFRDNEWQLFDYKGTDIILHIAGVTPATGRSSTAYYHVNRDQTVELARKAKSQGVKQFVYLSSMAVYGIEPSLDPSIGTINQDTPLCPKSDYGKSKLQAEEILDQMRDDSFIVSVVRAPSVYGKGNVSYLNQYKYLADKLPFIPVAYNNLKKSAICMDNLSNLMIQIVSNPVQGYICPDDGGKSAVEFCSAIYPNKRKSVIVGKGMELFLKQSDRIRDYYGCIVFDSSLSDVFDGIYRVTSFESAVRNAYE